MNINISVRVPISLFLHINLHTQYHPLNKFLAQYLYILHKIHLNIMVDLSIPIPANLYVKIICNNL